MLDMSTLLESVDPGVPRGNGGRFYGVYPAVVTEITDPDGQGRVRVKLPWSPDNNGDAYNVWARLATFMAGGKRGSWFIPDVDDEVLVSFEAGNTRRPYVIGCLWNGRDDSDGHESLTLKTPLGREITMKDGDQSIEIKDPGGNSIKLQPDGITINASANVNVKAGGMVNITAGMVKVDAAMSKFSGTVKADTVIANTVVGTSYTPGAGNIW